jgi:putative phosphoesterase
MLIGIMSDSHGRSATTARAVEALRDAGAEVLLHLGDIETEAVIDELVGHSARVVFGNCDWNTDALAHYAELVDVEVDHPAGRLEIDGRRIVFTHGHLPGPMNEALREGVDYLLHGHSHEVRDDRLGPTRVINPGALFRAARYTVAVLDPRRDEVSFIEIPKPDP